MTTKLQDPDGTTIRTFAPDLVTGPLPVVIGLAGPKGCGKSYVGQVLASELDQNLPFKAYGPREQFFSENEWLRKPVKSRPLATAVKAVSHHLLSWLLDELQLADLQNLGERERKAARIVIDPKESPISLRRIYQVIGTEVGQAVQRTVWVEIARRQILRDQRLDGTQVVIIDDVRFPHELPILDTLVFVEGPPVPPDAHASEQHLDFLRERSTTIIRNWPRISEEQLRHALEPLLVLIGSIAKSKAFYKN